MNNIKENISTIRRYISQISVPTRNIATYIKNNLKQNVEDIKGLAEQAYAGYVQLPGSAEPSFVGNPPQWFERRYNDDEYLWQLNRMNHWTSMAEYYAISGEEKYVDKIVQEIETWLESVYVDIDLLEIKGLDYFSQCNPLRSLELGIRLYKTWPLTLELIIDSPHLSDEILARFIDSIYKQAVLLRKVSPLIWPNADHNHYIMEMLGLLTTALYIPFFDESEEWKSFSIKELERCAKAQMTEDGGQIEGCPSYHAGCMFWFGIPVVLSQRFGFDVSQEYLNLYKKNLDYSAYATRPTGQTVPRGDSKANNTTMVAALYELACFDDLTLLNQLMVYMSDKDLRDTINEFIWRMPNVEHFFEMISKVSPSECDLPLVFFNKPLGQSVIKSGWGKTDLSVLFECRSPIQHMHDHIDVNSFDFCAYGNVLVSDPGYFCYREEYRRRWYKSTFAHSTLLVDDKDQFEYLASFNYGPQKHGALIDLKDFGSYQVVSGEHENYSPVIHLRHIAMVENKFLLVIDRVSGITKNLIRRNFHLDFTKHKDLLFYKDDVSLEIKSYPERETQFLEGHLSNKLQDERDATILSFVGNESADQTYVTVLYPLQKNENSKEICISSINEFSIDGKKYQIEYGPKSMTLNM